MSELVEENPNLAFTFQELMLNSKFTTFSGKLCPADFLHHQARRARLMFRQGKR